MLKKSLKITATILIGGIFLWLAFRNVKLAEIWEYSRSISLGWLIPFTLVAFTSHYLRAERWKLLIEHDKQHLDRFTLFSGVMAGYLLNLVVPRLGEVTRPVYVAKRENLNPSKLIGTIVLERVIDISTMGLILLVVVFYVIADPSLLSKIFGEEVIGFIKTGMRLEGIIALLFVALATAVLVYGSWKLIKWLGDKYSWAEPWVERISELVRMFVKGLTAAKKVERWWLFILLTALIWIGYTFMTFIPFYMFDMQEVFGLSFLDALTITIISAIGITIPSPGGLGTYHYFVKQALLILFAVPAVTGLAYATITHAAMVILVIVSTPVILAIDKFRLMKKASELEQQHN